MIKFLYLVGVLSTKIRLFSTNDLKFRNIETWELISSYNMVHYQRPEVHNADFSSDRDFKKIGEVIRVDGTDCLNKS